MLNNDDYSKGDKDMSTKNIEELESLAKNGDVGAIYELGKRYFEAYLQTLKKWKFWQTNVVLSVKVRYGTKKNKSYLLSFH